MIDFGQEIEVRLRHFQWLNGKGNVKDCNNTLCEIIRLMIGMINQNTSSADDLAYYANKIETSQSPPENYFHGDALEPDGVLPSDPSPKAPLGLTRFGNPKRDRSNHIRKPGH
jgi:hypothetical protein